MAHAFERKELHRVPTAQQGQLLTRHMSETFPLLRSPLQRPAVQFGGISTLEAVAEDGQSPAATPRKDKYRDARQRKREKEKRKSLSRFFHRPDAQVIPPQMLKTRYLIARRFRLRAILLCLAIIAVLPVILHVYTDLTSSGRSLRFVISSFLTASSLVSAVVVYKLFRVKTKLLATSDPLWYTTQHISESPFFLDFLLYTVVFLAHAPPLIEEWVPGVRFLNLLVFLRFVVFFHLLKDYKFFTSFSTRVVSFFANAALGWRFAIKTLLYRSPMLMLGSSVVVIWLGLAATYSLLEDSDGIEGGLWFVFVTATTVGFGDIVPKTFGGRVVAVASAVCGITASAFLVAIVRQSFDLQHSQQLVVDFMTHLHDQYQYRGLAARIIQTSFRLSHCLHHPHSAFSWKAVFLRRKLFKLCKKLHSTRVTFISVETSIFNPPDALHEAGYMALLQKLDELQHRVEEQETSADNQLKCMAGTLETVLLKVEALQEKLDAALSANSAPRVA